MTVQEAKEQVKEFGYVELQPGVFLEEGRQAIEDLGKQVVEDLGNEEGDVIQGIMADELYIVTNDGYFGFANDEDIEEILNGELV